MPLVISAFSGGVKEILKELKNMFEKDDLCEKILEEMQMTTLMDTLSFRKCCQDSSKVTE